MENLIWKYLHNELTKAEAADLKVWLERDSLNRKIFENIVSQWSLSDEEITRSKKKVLSNILDEASKSKEGTYSRRRIVSYVMRIAAILVVSFGLSFLVVISTDFDDVDRQVTKQEVLIEKEATPGQKLTFELSDGTVVKLNAGSKLIYPKTFSGNSRQVNLIGEAFFDVTRDEVRPFKVFSGAINVQVLGTSFNVRSYPGEDEIAVAVKTGNVAVSSKSSDKDLILVAEEMAVYTDKKLNKRQISDDELIFGWMDQSLILKEQHIDEILIILSRWYDVDFEVKKRFNKQKAFTAKYKNPSLHTVLESLSYAYDFNYELEGKKVIIK